MAYKATYKCRLCGETFSTGFTGKSVAWANMMHTLGLQDISTKIYGNPAEKQTVHTCDDDSLGLADFQGFKFEKEE